MSPSVDVNSFARRVLRATKNDQLNWAPATDDPSTYLASADAGAIRMSTFQVDDGAFATRLEILDTADRVTEMRETDPTRAGPWLDWEMTLNELYEAARFAGSGASDVIQGLTEQWSLPADPADDDIPF
jgi:hypothetical protein